MLELALTWAAIIAIALVGAKGVWYVIGVHDKGDVDEEMGYRLVMVIVVLCGAGMFGAARAGGVL